MVETSTRSTQRSRRVSPGTRRGRLDRPRRLAQLEPRLCRLRKDPYVEISQCPAVTEGVLVIVYGKTTAEVLDHLGTFAPSRPFRKARLHCTELGDEIARSCQFCRDCEPLVKAAMGRDYNHLQAPTSLRLTERGGQRAEHDK